MKKLLILFAILVFMVCSCVSPSSIIPQSAVKELAKDLSKLDEATPKIGAGLGHRKQDPFLITIPAGHPDFTVWPIVEYGHITPEVTILRVAKSGKGCYRIVLCEWEPMIIALQHSCGVESSFWVYEDKVPVEVTGEEFKEKLTEAQYLCPGKGQGV